MSNLQIRKLQGSTAGYPNKVCPAKAIFKQLSKTAVLREKTRPVDAPFWKGAIIQNSI